MKPKSVEWIGSKYVLGYLVNGEWLIEADWQRADRQGWEAKKAFPVSEQIELQRAGKARWEKAATWLADALRDERLEARGRRMVNERRIAGADFEVIPATRFDAIWIMGDRTFTRPEAAWRYDPDALGEWSDVQLDRAAVEAIWRKPRVAVPPVANVVDRLARSGMLRDAAIRLASVEAGCTYRVATDAWNSLPDEVRGKRGQRKGRNRAPEMRDLPD